MITSSIAKAASVLVFCGFSASAFASPLPATDTIMGSSFSSGSSSFVDNTFLGTIQASFTAWKGTDLLNLTDAKFSVKAAQDHIQGVGVSPLTGTERTSGEIDTNEFIKGTFSSGVVVKNFSVGLLFDGPEYGDVNEVAKVSVFYKGSSTATSFTLTAKGPSLAVWSSSNGTVTNMSPATNGMGGAWKVENPFGNQAITSIYFTAVDGKCGVAGGSCNNQSDYTFNSITAAVPEPETYAMLLAGLGLISAAVKRRKVKQA